MEQVLAESRGPACSKLFLRLETPRTLGWRFPRTRIRVSVSNVERNGSVNALITPTDAMVSVNTIVQ
jgi:hypothetical protein